MVETSENGCFWVLSMRWIVKTTTPLAVVSGLRGVHSCCGALQWNAWRMRIVLPLKDTTTIELDDTGQRMWLPHHAVMQKYCVHDWCVQYCMIIACTFCSYYDWFLLFYVIPMVTPAEICNKWSLSSVFGFGWCTLCWCSLIIALQHLYMWRLKKTNERKYDHDDALCDDGGWFAPAMMKIFTTGIILSVRSDDWRHTDWMTIQLRQMPHCCLWSQIDCGKEHI